MNTIMKKRILAVILMLVLVIFGTGVAGKKRKKSYDCSKKVARAVTSFQKERYNKVKTILEEVKSHCSGHSVMDTTLYYLGKAHLATKQPFEASIEFEVLIQDFPNSSYNEEVHFLLGLCCYKESPSYEREQNKTKDAIREFTEFIEMFPKSPFVDSAKFYLEECHEKMAKKEFMSARFYERIDKFESAIVYYKLIIEEFPKSEFIAESRLSLARNLIKVSRPTEAAEILDALLSSDADVEVKRKAKLLLNRIEKLDGIKPPEIEPEEPDKTKKSSTSL